MKIWKFFVVFFMLFVFPVTLLIWLFFRGVAVDFYGKVIDQYGHPVEGMKVEYDAHRIRYVTTGADGVFHIDTRMSDRWLSIRYLKKDNHEARSLMQHCRIT